MKAMKEMRTWTWRLLVSLCLVCAASNVPAVEGVTDIILLGAKQGKGNALKNSYREQGWTVVDKDLNDNAGGWDVYIAYKTSSDANPETGYITDICVSTSKENTKTLEGRTYYLAPTNNGYNGDLNRDAGGADIWVYYTRDHQNHTAYGGTQRVITKLSTTKDPEDGYSTTSAVSWRWTSKFSGLADVNEDAGGDDIYIQQHFETQTLTIKNNPVPAENIVYDGTPKFLVESNPDNHGTMKYRVGTGGWLSSLPRATRVGTYTIEYYLDGGIYALNSESRSIQATIQPPVFKASNLDASFNQADKAVHLVWEAGTAPGDYDDFQWVLYRGKTKIATLPYNQRIYTDKGYENEKTETYTLYYVANQWDIETKRDDAAISKSVDCTRRVPVNNFKAEAHPDYIEFTWTSDGYPLNFGNKFTVYIDKESSPALTITPRDYQTSFVLRHRTTSEHDNRQTYYDENEKVYYIEEPLNGCQPHDYRVEGVIGDAKLGEASVSKKGIGQGTLFVSLSAEKGVFPGVVKLNWQVDQQQAVLTSKTYIIDRRMAERIHDPWQTIHRMNSADEFVSYTDETPLPGIYYDYRVTVQDKCDDGTVIQNEITDIGFANTTGTVSGRVTYGTTGTAVAGVNVVAMKSGGLSDDESEQYRSMHFTDRKGIVEWEYPSDAYQSELVNGDFSIQLWIYPEQLYSSGILFLADNIFFAITEEGKLVFVGGNKTSVDSCSFGGLKIDTEKYNFITFTRSGNTMTAYVVTTDEYGSPVVNKASHTILDNLEPVANPLLLIFNVNTNKFMRLGNFKGYADEFRLWKRCLSEEEIKENFDHLLVGNENGLETYWTFDENLRYVFFDSSRDGTTYHQHHGRVGSNAERASLTPSALSLKAKTDKDGNYIIRGIPFSGEGATYSIVPTFGVHRFNPTQQLRYISNNSLVHNSVDFDDVSSFRVRGVVYYENTTIPVQDAQLYVDASAAVRDGEIISTNDYGEFEISVPIGDHFISVKKNGHTFVNGGRYPADPDNVGLRYTFEQEMSGLTFYDNTLVTVAGRVAGGDPEFNKPLGFGQGIANIGQAKLRIELSNENGYLNAVMPDENSTAVSFDINPENRNFESAAGQAYVPGNKNYIEVLTDPATGEWVAQLLPLKYDVTDVTFPYRPNTDAITKENFSLPVIDATKPTNIYTDSVELEDGIHYFEYVASAKMEYKAVSVIDVVENNNGTFGERTFTVTDINNVDHEVALYAMDENGAVVPDENGKVQYTFGYPVYIEMNPYIYSLHAYERYANYDADPNAPIVTEVPLAGSVVTIKNQFASTTAISIKTDSTELGDLFSVANESFELDENGKALYQFQVGFPNIQEPFTRSISISYDNNGTEMGWSENGKFQAIVLGDVPTGNNFVTAGPDKVIMVLRDPPGSNSSTVWKKGATLTTTYTHHSVHDNQLGGTVRLKFGLEEKFGAGTGAIVITSLQSVEDTEVSGYWVSRVTHTNVHNKTFTVTQDISTSSSNEFVGAVGDVFVGESTNRVFGSCYAVDIVMVDGVPTLKKDTSISLGEEFKTMFTYDQYYIEQTLIPNYKMLRNNLLTHVDDIDAVVRPATGDPIYVTTLNPDDYGYGSSNDDEAVWGSQAKPIETFSDGKYVGPSYTMILPEDFKNGAQDMIGYYNDQVTKWIKQLSLNEKEKRDAIENRSERLIKNYSLSAGATFTCDTTSSKFDSNSRADMDGGKFVFSAESGFFANGFGMGFQVYVEETKTGEDIDGTETDSISTIGFTLSDSDYADYLSVDVLEAKDGGSPIFVTRGGATSCPYEDQDTTKYYQPGSELSAKTMQIEKPEIEVVDAIVTGVPAGEAANIRVKIRNNCEVGYNVVYDVKVVEGSNPDGLSVMMDDVSLNRGTSVFVQPDQTIVKTITVRQTNPDVLEYKDIKLRIHSQCQYDPQLPRGDIADHATFSVYFQPSCSDIKLESSHTLVNTDTESPMTLSMSGYNYSLESLKGIRLQYKAENDADFRTIQEYTKDPDRIAADPNLKLLTPLEGTAKLEYVLDLRSADYADKTYIFRAVTVCDQGGKEVTNESEEIRVIRDMSRPVLIATPSPSNGVLSFGDDILITFNEDIQGTVLSKPNNFDVTGILNEGEVAHDVALNIAGEDVTAKTDATINLIDKSFAFSMWLNFTTDGTILTHGTAEHHIALMVENSKLAVIVGEQKVTSTPALPVGKWFYLNVSYDAQNNILNAGYAQDDFSTILLENVATEHYHGNGDIRIGDRGFTGQIQELVLWDNKRTMMEAQSTMYTTKSRYTPGLLGYWPFNEGNGTTAVDIARSRNVTLASQNSWWINGANYALPLDGMEPAIVSIGAINTFDSEDFLIELWFKAGKTQADVASILKTDQADIRLSEDGYLQLVLNELPVVVLGTDLRDDQWHHLALNVLKSTNGSGIIYLDGNPCRQFAASALPNISGAQLILGQGLKGAIDEIRIWKARHTADVIKNNRFTRLMASEAGLVAYYPMERCLRDEYNQIVVTPTRNDLTSDLTLTGASAELVATATAPLKPAPKVENVQFNFVTSERQIKINLDEYPAKIEGCNISITAKRIKDMNGNEAQPVAWNVLVQQNLLTWNKKTVSATKIGDEETTFTAKVVNAGSTSESWSVSGLPTWLSVNDQNGVLSPLSDVKLTFTVAQSLPIGTYETTIYLTGSQNISDPLKVTVSCQGEVPDWSVTPGESTMTIIGVLNNDGIQSTDPNDIIAAFNGNECVGLAHPQYMSRFDSYLVLLTVYGQQTAALNYKIYDASTGTIYPSVSASNEEAYTFAGDKNIGSFTSPVIFTPLNEIEQDLSHDRASWKWFSLYAEPKENTISAVFKDATAAISVVTNGEQSLMSWMGDLQSFNYDKMYKLEAKEPYEQRFVGTPTNPTEIDITLKANGWTWIGYPAQATNSLDAAFAGAEPLDGDMVKNQSKFALYTEGEWLGTLTTLQPGDGYMYSSNASTDKVFRFPKPVVVGRNIAPRKVAGEETETMLFKDNMTMLAVVMSGATVVEDAQVSVFANGEWRGASTQALRDGIHFLTVGGEAGDKEPLTFIVTLENGHTAAIPSDLFFEADAHYGTMIQPVIIRLDSPTALDNTGAETAQPQKVLYRGMLYIIRNGELYDATGKKL